MDYNGLFGDLVDMWSRAVSAANESDDFGFNGRCLCMQMLREIAQEAV